MIRSARIEDVERISEIYSKIHEEEEQGRMNVGWKKGVYPTAETAKEALCRKDLFVEEDQNGLVVAAGIINQIQLPEYAICPWKYPAEDTEVMVLHTLVVDPEESGHGYAKEFVCFYQDYALQNNCHYLRIDTQEKNLAARKLYAKLGFQEPAIVDCVFNGIEGVKLVCLEKRI